MNQAHNPRVQGVVRPGRVLRRHAGLVERRWAQRRIQPCRPPTPNNPRVGAADGAENPGGVDRQDLRSHCASLDRRLQVVELVAAMGTVLLRPGFVVEGIDGHVHVRTVAGGLQVDGREMLVRLVVGHEVDQ